jgi:hypothetical protein
MVQRSSTIVRRHRQHGAVLQQADRRDLERAGWRTTLEFRENNIRGRDGTLLQVETIWHAEAERDPARHRRASRQSEQHAERGIDFIYATAETVDAVWTRLRIEAELADVRRIEDAQAPAC